MNIICKYLIGFLFLALFSSPKEAQAQYFYQAPYYQSQFTYYRVTPSRGFFLTFSNGYASPWYGPPLFFPYGQGLMPVYPAFVPVVPVVVPVAPVFVRPVAYYGYTPVFFSTNPFGVPFTYSFSTVNFGLGPFGW